MNVVMQTLDITRLRQLAKTSKRKAGPRYDRQFGESSSCRGNRSVPNPSLTAIHVIMHDSMYYHILGLDTTASKEDIKEAYRLTAQVWHPDKFESNQNIKLQAKSKEMMKKINEAYDYLITLSEKQHSAGLVEPESPFAQAGNSINIVSFQRLDVECRAIIEKEIAMSKPASMFFNKDTMCVKSFTQIHLRIREFVVTDIIPNHPNGRAAASATNGFLDSRPLNYIYERKLPLLKTEMERKAILLSLIMSAYEHFFGHWHDLVLKSLTSGVCDFVEPPF